LGIDIAVLMILWMRFLRESRKAQRARRKRTEESQHIKASGDYQPIKALTLPGGMSKIE
jgi:hypothetical protein